MPAVSFEANILGNEARAGEYLSGGFLCGVDALRVQPGVSLTRGFSASVAGIGSLSPSLNVFRLLNFQVNVAGVATVSPMTLGKRVDFAVHLGSPYLCGEHICGTFVCDTGPQADITATLGLTRSLLVDIGGRAGVIAVIGYTIYFAAPIKGQATVSIEVLTYVYIWPSDCLDIDLVPAPAGDLVLVASVPLDIDLEESECH